MPAVSVGATGTTCGTLSTAISTLPFESGVSVIVRPVLLSYFVSTSSMLSPSTSMSAAIHVAIACE